MRKDILHTLRTKTVQHRLWLILVLAILGVFAVVLQSFLSFINVGRAESAPQEETSKTQSLPSAFEGITLEARAAYVLDITSQRVLFAKNEQESLPLASVTKLMTALVAHEYVQGSMVATISREDLAIEGDAGLRLGERWRVADLMDVMLLISSNDAAHAVAGLVGREDKPNAGIDPHLHFVDLMNQEARTLGLSTMQFFNESGLDVENESKAGGYGSARDVALLAQELWKRYPSSLEATTRDAMRIVSQDGVVHVLPNTNEALGKYPGMIGSKTGYTSLAGGNLAIIFDISIGHPVVAVVLGSTREGRFEDMRVLTQATLKALE